MRGNKKIVEIVMAETKIYVFVLVGLVVFCLSSCKKNKQKDDTVQTVKEWTGKKVKFPKKLFCTSMGKDTACVDVYNDNYKILLYVDSLGCTSCRLKLYEWKKIMQESDTAFIRKPEFVFIFQPKKNGEEELLQSIFRQNGFHHPVFIDKDNVIAEINKFPSNPEYQCFLLDKNNKVLLVGNPALVPGIWILYKKIISERETK